MKDASDLSRLTTESANPKSARIDALDSLSIVRLINDEDRQIADAVGQAAASIASAVDVVVEVFQHGGRLVYIGAGTSGRLGILDASECPPTFNSPPEMVVGIIAGGDRAIRCAIEGAEDDPLGAQTDLERIDLTANDCVFGIATSGRTPYVLGGLQFARKIGARTVGLACNTDSEMTPLCDCLIEVVVGPEIVSGSTRMKAGTATKLVLNSVTTAAMIRIGKTYGNLMVDLRASNTKLIARSLRLVSILTGLSSEESEQLLSKADKSVKTAIVMHHRGVDLAAAQELLRLAGGRLRQVIGDCDPSPAR